MAYTCAIFILPARISTAEAKSAANQPATRMALLSASKSSLEATSASLEALDAAIAEAKSLRASHATDPRSSAESISCMVLDRMALCS